MTSAKLTNEIVAVFVIEVAGLLSRYTVHVVVELLFYGREEVNMSNDDGFSHADRARNGWLIGNDGADLFHSGFIDCRL